MTGLFAFYRRQINLPQSLLQLLQSPVAIMRHLVPHCLMSLREMEDCEEIASHTHTQHTHARCCCDVGGLLLPQWL